MMDSKTTHGVRRRDLLHAAAVGLLGASAAARSPAAVQDEAKGGSGAPPITLNDADAAEVERKLREVGLGEPRRLKSNHYLAIGDAAESFMRSSLTDCELLALAYLRHFQDRGFDVKEPERPLLVIGFLDERSFGKYYGMPSTGGAQPVGLYERSTNVLSVFDWRNVPMVSRASTKNVQTIAHEVTHQLTFNTGLLERAADIPVSIMEGLGTYGEPRKVLGPSDLGRLNLGRLDDLAKLRRSIAWIPIRELLVDDSAFRQGLFGRVLLAYAESWTLVHFLLNHKDRLPGFRDYLKVLRTRKTSDHRIEDAKEHLGDLDELNRDVQAYSVRLLRSL
ncbi:DUF1570 domain-containing protein [Planctomyces sp. SH-PL62]|uniref:DUF1570 domain-containing protein n=1 Tax=Planctomyces sp. SH-PL62 TaxID=1636152 RepID=UPI00078C1B0C|nr:DUF1570 domain-containing protein [Planctomyces sp. SH-PL62]AMV36650.1 hypothetical protein VT85_04400 [Planctomyces sp. SH-PL62]